MLSFIDTIPAKQNISHAESLNVLGGVANIGEATSADISLWGKTDRDWQRLETQRLEMDANEHKHLYFTLKQEVVSACFGDEEIEEIELAISNFKPAKPGVIVFIE